MYELLILTMEHFHEVLVNASNHVQPGNQVDVDSFISARNQEIQSLLQEIRKLLNFYNIRK